MIRKNPFGQVIDFLKFLPLRLEAVPDRVAEPSDVSPVEPAADLDMTPPETPEPMPVSRKASPISAATRATMPPPSRAPARAGWRAIQPPVGGDVAVSGTRGFPENAV